MTDAQRDAVAKAHEILGEHFEAHVIITAAADAFRVNSCFTEFDAGATKRSR